MSYLDTGWANQLFANSVQLQDIRSALFSASIYAAIIVNETGGERKRWKMRKFSYLNRACELACVPLAQYYAESSNGDLDFVWVTYRPEAVSTGPRSVRDAMVYLGSVDKLTEDQARSRAIGW